MKIAFITESNFTGKYPVDFPNSRTEIAWQHALNADHFPFNNLHDVIGYDHVFVIFPKGDLTLNAVGCELVKKHNPVSYLFATNFVNDLKERNNQVYFIQEGPVWLFNDYDLPTQINYINRIYECDAIFCHNQKDINWYSGLFPSKPVHVIPTLLNENLIKDIIPNKQDKTIIGGNFAKWYGGFQSYSVATAFGTPIYVPSMHAKREYEDQMENLTHLPYMNWLDWMKELSTYRYAVHLMSTVAAGTFSLNAAYFGIPCIGNIEMDSQRKCFPDLSVNVEDVLHARDLASQLKNDKMFYLKCSEYAMEISRTEFGISRWLSHMKGILHV